MVYVALATYNAWPNIDAAMHGGDGALKAAATAFLQYVFACGVAISSVASAREKGGQVAVVVFMLVNGYFAYDASSHRHPSKNNGILRKRSSACSAKSRCGTPAEPKGHRLKTAADLPADMVFVSGGASAITRNLEPTAVPAFMIDRHEVTNAAYKEFVEAGGYERRSLWDGFDFRKDGRSLPVGEALRLFVDSTGRPGPGAWELGTYPEGRGNYPVSGISWYEAMAYARFRGRSLPTAYHWLRAAVPGSELAVSLSASIAPASNYGTAGPAPVGQYPGLGPWGTYDMFGNVREWLLNPGAQGGWMAGGSWEDPAYAYSELIALPLLDRSRANGIRLMKAVGGAADGASLQAAIDPGLNARDPRTAKPVSDEIYATYSASSPTDRARSMPRRR